MSRAPQQVESGRLGRLGLNVDDIDLEDLIHVVAIDDINGGPAWSWRQVIQDDLTDDEDLVSIAACALRDFNLDGSHAIVGVWPSLPLCRDGVALSMMVTIISLRSLSSAITPSGWVQAS